MLYLFDRYTWGRACREKEGERMHFQLLYIQDSIIPNLPVGSEPEGGKGAFTRSALLLESLELTSSSSHPCSGWKGRQRHEGHTLSLYIFKLPTQDWFTQALLAQRHPAVTCICQWAITDQALAATAFHTVLLHGVCWKQLTNCTQK